MLIRIIEYDIYPSVSRGVRFIGELTPYFLLLKELAFLPAIQYPPFTERVHRAVLLDLDTGQFQALAYVYPGVYTRIKTATE